MNTNQTPPEMEWIVTRLDDGVRRPAWGITEAMREVGDLAVSYDGAGFASPIFHAVVIHPTGRERPFQQRTNAGNLMEGGS